MATEKQPAKTTPSTARQRGRGFPVVPLPEAVEVVTAAAKYGTSHQISALAGYMGHKTTNSGQFKQRFAALRDWGLVTKDGDTVSLTDLAKRLALPTDRTRIAHDLIEAFRNVDEFKQVYEDSAKGVTLDLDNLANNAVHSLGVSVKAKASFAESFAKSAVAAGLATRPSDGQLILQAKPGDAATPPDEGDGHEITPPDRKTGATPVVFRQTWPVSGGEVSLDVRLDHPLPATSFERVGALVAEAEKLVKALGVDDGVPSQ